MKSITMVTCRVRAWASAVIRSIWWLLPSTRATQVRSGAGSRRSASAKIWATTDAASATTLAVSHLFDDTERAQIHPGPVTSNKWLTASVVADAASVVAQIFAEADRRDPDHDLSLIHISEPTRLGMISYAVFCLKKKKKKKQ